MSQYQLLQKARQYLLNFVPILKEGNIENALKILMLTLTVYAKNKNILIGKEKKEFQDFFEKAFHLINLDPTIKKVLEESISYSPGNELKYLHVLKDVPKKIHEYNEIEKIRNIEMKKQERSDRLEKGFTLLRQRYFDGAMQHFNRLVKDYPDDHDLNVSIGDMLFEIGHIEAISFYENATKLDEKDSFSYAQMALMFRKLKKYDESEECYLKALELEPDNVNFMFNLARVYIDTTSWERAQTILKAALILKPDFKEAQKALDFSSKNLRSL